MPSSTEHLRSAESQTVADYATEQSDADVYLGQRTGSSGPIGREGSSESCRDADAYRVSGPSCEPRTVSIARPTCAKNAGQPLLLGNHRPLALFAGPCTLESRDLAMDVAGTLHAWCQDLGIPFVFKASFDKANRTSVTGARGMGWDKAALIFQDIRRTFGCPIMTDVHHPEQCALVAEVADVLQIPAFLCRQTDLVLAAAATGRPLNIKKGQFLAPQDMVHVLAKAQSAGNAQLWICERGTCFGYRTLINDMRGLAIMGQTGFPLIFDATHSVQQPGALDGKTGGERGLVEVLARAAVSAGVAGVFFETHPDPDCAVSDGPNMIPLAQMRRVLQNLIALDVTTKALPYAPCSLAPTWVGAQL